MRPEELTPGQFVEVTRLLFGVEGEDWATNKLGNKVWRKLKHGTSPIQTTTASTTKTNPLFITKAKETTTKPINNANNAI
eukprot:scaffold809_cov69-Alexandrium_tamarense.AAC.1